jgi:hypothetical protein
VALRAFITLEAEAEATEIVLGTTNHLIFKHKPLQNVCKPNNAALIFIFSFPTGSF